MITKIEQEGFYLINIEKEKNFVFLKPMGLWGKPEDVPNYLGDLEKALGMVKKGFLLLVDLKDMKPPKLMVTSLLSENQKMIAKAGVGKTAVVVPAGQIMKKLSLSVVGRLSGLPMKVFNDEAEANSWLSQN